MPKVSSSASSVASGSVPETASPSTSSPRSLPARRTKKLARSHHFDKITKQIHADKLERAVSLALEEKKKNPSGRFPNGFIQGLLAGYQLTRGQFYYALDLKTKSQEAVASVEPNDDAASSSAPLVEQQQQHAIEDPTPAERNEGERRKVAAAMTGKEREIALENARAWAAEELLRRRGDLEDSRERKRLPKGTLTKLIQEAKEKFNVDPSEKIREGTILTRAQRKTPTLQNGLRRGVASPMQDIEGFLVAFIVSLARLNVPEKRTNFLESVNSLIEGSELEKRVIAWKELHCGFKPDPNNPRAQLGLRYYDGFLRRHKDEINEKFPAGYSSDRQDWATFSNIKFMYDSIYKCLHEEAGILAKLAEPLLLNKQGSIVDTEERAYGLPVQYVVTNPEHLLFVDEVGNNTAQRVGGSRSVDQVMTAEINYATETAAAAASLPWSTIGFTAATGEPVLCAVVMKGEKRDLPLMWSQGCDLFAECDDVSDHNGSVEEWLRANAAKGKLLPGGPECVFRGKRVPCFVTASPYAGITGESLTDILRYIDDLELLPRVEGGPIPSLILNGHNSRFDLDFLMYTNAEKTKWCVCLGTPCSTHIWQVTDNSLQQEQFKIGYGIFSANQVTLNKAPNVPIACRKSDIVPITNAGWERSFANVAGNKDAIAERGWNPCNYNCLLHPEIQKTKPNSNQ